MKGIFTERTEKDRENDSSICCFTTQMTATVKAELIQSQELPSHHVGWEAQGLWSPSSAFSGHKEGWIGSGAAEHKPIPVWDADTISKRLACHCADPRILRFKSLEQKKAKNMLSLSHPYSKVCARARYTSRESKQLVEGSNTRVVQGS